MPETLLERAMRVRGVSQPELARRIGLSQPHIHRLVKGISTLKPHHIEKIAAALDCSPGEISEDYMPALSPLARKLLAGFEKLTPSQQEAYVQQLSSIVEHAAEPRRMKKAG